MAKNFFKNDSERKLWIKLNAEHIQYSNKFAYNIDEEIGSIDEPYSPMWVSKNQLEFDEERREAPRFSLDELLLLSSHDLYKLSRKKMQAKINEFYCT